MKTMTRSMFAAIALFTIQMAPNAASAAMTPAGLGASMATIDPVQTETVTYDRGHDRGGGRHGGGGGRHGGGWGGGHHGGGWGRHHWGWGGHYRWGWDRPHWGYAYSCFRRERVWTGYGYEWRRYRVC